MGQRLIATAPPTGAWGGPPHAPDYDQAPSFKAIEDRRGPL